MQELSIISQLRCHRSSNSSSISSSFRNKCNRKRLHIRICYKLRLILLCKSYWTLSDGKIARKTSKRTILERIIRSLRNSAQNTWRCDLSCKKNLYLQQLEPSISTEWNKEWIIRWLKNSLRIRYFYRNPSKGSLVTISRRNKMIIIIKC